MFERVLTGGLLIDPASGTHEHLDVAIEEGRIAAVGSNLASLGKAVEDLHGAIVVPGLVDLHTHLYPGGSDLGVDADAACLAAGVTTAIDAGSAGMVRYGTFETEVVRSSTTRVLGFVNLSSLGLPTDDGTELRNMRHVNVEGAARTVRERSSCIGIKVRLGQQMVSGVGARPLRAAVRAAELADCPVMVHVTNPGIPLAEILAALRPGDIVTHVMHGTGETILDGDHVREDILQAQAAGVIMDVGHGATSFCSLTARRAIDGGFVPNTISTDLHTGNVRGPVFDLPTTMSKLLALGLTLDQVIAAATVHPARAIGESSIGTLRVGASADLAVMLLRNGPVTFIDGRERAFEGTRRLEVVQTLKSGRVAHPPDRL